MYREILSNSSLRRKIAAFGKRSGSCDKWSVAFLRMRRLKRVVPSKSGIYPVIIAQLRSHTSPNAIISGMSGRRIAS